MKQQEERLIELLETKSYDALTMEERRLVDEEMTKSAYEFQRKILLEASVLESSEIPRPIVFGKKTRILPLVWTASISAAAAVLIMFWALPKQSIELNFGLKTATPVATVDTVFVEKKVVDTVVTTVVQKEYVVQSVAQKTSDFQLEAYAAVPQGTLGIRASEVVNQGRSAKDDEAYNQLRPEPFIGM